MLFLRRHTGIVVNCYAMGDVSGSIYDDVYVGGLVGWAYDASIQNCFAWGNVTGRYGNTPFVYCYGIGGLIGKHENSEVLNCYRYEGQKVVKYHASVAITLPGEDDIIIMTQDQFNDCGFYTNTLGWDRGVWKINGLCLEEGWGPGLTCQQ